ncbi:helix-turn-helix domain-containing protein [Salinilacihabitans rarus]|uniref:helix-turn-helix domain-containing protein n=1 Tax=Salinilacihabitans rarus TaxID=2961596 RepID=UPI0020C8DC30|nr:helix-turn-helix domain-containing protein [Salinilacihabitans rarus]
MAQATLAVTMPEEVWVQQVSTAHPEATLRVLAAVPGSESGFALVRIAGPDVPSVLEDMDEHPQITELTLAQWSENEATIHFETTAPLLMFSSRDSGMPIELPVEIQDGEAIVEVTGSRERLSELAGQLERFGLQYRIEHVRERVHDSQLLSERQREVVMAAVEEGYYDTPRCCSLTELAGRLGIAKSTCSETLHRAEEAIIKRFVRELPTADEPDALEDGLANEPATSE